MLFIKPNAEKTKIQASSHPKGEDWYPCSPYLESHLRAGKPLHSNEYVLVQFESIKTFPFQYVHIDEIEESNP